MSIYLAITFQRTRFGRTLCFSHEWTVMPALINSILMTTVKYVSLDDPPGPYHHGTFFKSYRGDVKGFWISFDKKIHFLIVCVVVCYMDVSISHTTSMTPSWRSWGVFLCTFYIIALIKTGSLIESEAHHVARLVVQQALGICPIMMGL